MRNQNIYTSRITGGLMVGSPGNTKPLSLNLQRGFVVFARNATEATLSFRMRILNQPVGGRASFDQNPGPAVTQIDVMTPPRSMASRTVHVTSSNPEAQVDVEVVQIVAPAGAEVPGGLKGSVSLNADIENPGIEADIENADIENNEVHNADIENADIENADIENADIENADIENNLIPNADIENADIENVDIDNADIENADIENADIENSAPFDPVDGVITDITWSMTNEGNTTSAYNVNLFLNEANVPPGIRKQLVLRKVYKLPVGSSCVLKEIGRNVLIANILDPEFLPFGAPLPDPNDPSVQNGTLWLAKGETGQITLRIIDPDKSNNVIVDGVSIDPAILPVTPVVQSQSQNGGPDAPPDEVAVPPLTVVTFSLPGATAGVPYAQTLQTSGGTGTPPTWSVVGGSLPTGLALNPLTGELAGTIDPAARGVFEFTVQVADEDVPPQTDTQLLSISVDASADLSIAKLDDPDPAVAGNDLTYTITVSNAGPSTAMAVVITDSLPGSASFVSASAGCAEAAGQVQCAVGTLAPGTSAMVTVAVRPTAPGILVNTASVTAAETDPTSPNVATASTTVTASADLALTISDAPDPVVSGGNITYTLTVTNLGPSNATAVTVTDQLAVAVEFVSATPLCSHNTGTVTCSIAMLARNAVMPLSITVKTSAPGTVGNTATAAAFEPDPNPVNNAATASTTVVPPVDIALPSAGERTAQATVPYALSLNASGGEPPYTWSLIDGELPEGFSLNPTTGVISGTTLTTGAFDITVRAQDAAGQFDTLALCITVLQPPLTQLTTTSMADPGGPTVIDLVETLLGQGVAISNVELKGVTTGAGVFAGAAGVLGFDSGIILSSGNVNSAMGSDEGSNGSDSTTTGGGAAGDADLTLASGQPTNDAAVIEFDFVPSGNQVSFRYVFASEEYNEFVATQFNDVFGFFITGPDNVKRNWAIVPGTTNLPVAINTINGGIPFGSDNASNPTLYRNNDLNDGGATIAIEADGLTVVLTLTATVVPGETHHMKLAIADAGDTQYDSWVFIEGGSFHAVENCGNGVDDDGDGLVDAEDPDCQVCHDEGPVLPEPVVIEVPGTAGGQANPHQSPTGGPPVQAMLLGPNEQVSVTATGLTSLGGPLDVTPDGFEALGTAQFLAPGLRAFSLIARAGEGPWQFVGTGPTILQAGVDGGYLEFAMNDDWHDDNFGEWTVTIQRLSEPPEP